MPRQGLPRCRKCNYQKWVLVEHRESSSTIQCSMCGTIAETRSNRRNALKRASQWSDVGQVVDDYPAWPRSVLECDEVLYGYDGPRIFTMWSAGNPLLLAYCCDTNPDRFIIVPISPEDLDALKLNDLTVYAALSDPGSVMVATVADDWTITEWRRVKFTDVPRDHLPSPGAYILPC